MDTTPDMLPNKIYVNLKCAITLENKQLSIWEVVFMKKSLQTYYNLKSSISQGNTLNICLNIYLVIGIIIMVTIFFKSSSVLPHLFNLSNLSELEADLKTQQLFSLLAPHLYCFSVFQVICILHLQCMTVSIVLHIMNKKMVTESLGTETNNFKP